jgi:hypothetical protein
MKNKILCLSTLLLMGTAGFSQSKFYNSYGAEMLISGAQIEDHGSEANSVLRFAPVINIQSNLNTDINEHFGFYAGLTLRNVGYAYDQYNDPASENIDKKKFRSYNIGIPIGLKFGNLSKFYVFAGYEFELPFAYKEKTYRDEVKINKSITWFSDRQQRIQHGFMIGAQFATGANITFKYYLSEFHNQDYVDADGYKPYGQLKSNIFYLSVGYMLFRELDDIADTQ